jgi:ABC-type Zn uptake system ZnuABC Zn-binding protein ZnuA
MKTGAVRLAVALAALFAASSLLPPDAGAGEKKLNVLATTFPICQITKNVARGRGNVNVELMIPARAGCPHDYALTPTDMKKLAAADVLVVNGLGMEEFLGAPVEKANRKLKTIDSSAGIGNLLRYSDAEPHEKRHPGGDRGHEHGHADHHAHHAGVNPHLFASPRMAALLASNIAEGLSRFDPAGAGTYRANAAKYAETLNRLADDLSAAGKRLANNRIVTQHGVFDYLARDMGLKVVAVVAAHPGEEISAGEMRGILETVKREKAGAVFTEPQYHGKTGRAIAREAGIPVAVLDPVATGPENAPPDYYETAMRGNLDVLVKTLGTK